MWLNGKCALVTGSSRGIGRGIALKLAEHGARVAITYVENEAAAWDSLAQVRGHGSDGFVVRVDVSRPDDIGRMLGAVRDEFGRLDILVSNARGELPTFYQPPLELTPERWDCALNTQARAFLSMVQQATDLLPDGGRIVALTYAPGGRLGSWQPWVAMDSAKAALESLCRYFAVALASRSITVNAVSPGFTDGSVLNSLPEAAQSLIKARHEGGWTPAGRLGTPADIGNVVALLCSEQASWVTGQVITADGGGSLMEPGLPLELQRG
ncbi:MAG: SDR family oxidoreductase [Chloroflexi bacterium]|nr:SDR family oxidoreductase [Chloroflexota bacterium]